MAIFFNNESYLRCPKCGTEKLYTKKASRIKRHPKIKGVFIQEVYAQEIRCYNCNELVETVAVDERHVLGSESSASVQK